MAAFNRAPRAMRHLFAAAAIPFMLLLVLAVPAHAALSISVDIAPPALPLYDQPPCPGDGYIWTPGYWAWGDGDYYWLPGTWVLAPEPALLWTPPYWQWDGVRFVFHEGYWGPHVGFYGGINYGFGYGGVGFQGGYWNAGHFYYNRAITNINETVVHNVYTKTVIHNTTNVESFNGGTGGATARPTTEELRAEHERHVPPVAAQIEHLRSARSNRALHTASNHGRPPTHQDQEHDDRQVMHARQEQERRELQQRQAADARRMEQQHADEQRRSEMAHEHARQVQELSRRHEQEEHELEARRKRRHPA
jgi:hypothetical protein